MLKNWKLGPKLTGGFLFGAAMAAVIGVIGAFELNSAASQAQRSYQNTTVPIATAGRIAVAFQKVGVLVRDEVAAETPGRAAAAAAQIKTLSGEITDAVAELERLPLDAQARASLAAFTETRTSYRADLGRIADLARAKRSAEARAVLDGSAARNARVEEQALTGMVEHLTANSKAAADASQRKAAGASTLMLLLVLACSAAAAGLGFILTRSITRPMGRMTAAAQALAQGDVQQTIDHRSGDELGLLADSLRNSFDYVQEVASAADALAAGDLSTSLAARSDKDLLAGSFQKVTSELKELAADVDKLACAAREGSLEFRADAGKHQGEYRGIIQGVNDALDMLIVPVNMAAMYVDQISKGEIPPKIEQEFAGDFNTLKDNLNTCIDAVNALVSDASMLSEATLEGRLATRADAGRHQGDFSKIIQGFNDTLDTVVTPLMRTAEHLEHLSKGVIDDDVTADYKGDFIRLKVAFNRAFEAVRRLVTDADMLSDAALQGRLSARADVTQHEGDFRKVVQGVNDTLDAVMAPIAEASSALEKLAQRDLRVRVHGDYQGEHSKIKEALNTTAESLHETMVQVASAVEQVSAAAAQIAGSSQNVADGASQQASALEETSSSLESMASMTKQSADNAQQANALAQTARAGANEGSASMQEMSDAMGKVKAAAEGTSQIIKDINEIAFQTNLLALNAAVEAARAGEAGRGFAVVAEEVRSLALRSKEAAMKTEELIKESVNQAGAGAALTKEVGGKLGEIVTAVSKVSDIVGEIAAASKEQATGIDQITKAIAQMDKVTQQNAANSEESSSAAAQLSGQSEELAAMIGNFQLNREKTAGAAPGRGMKLTTVRNPQNPSRRELRRPSGGSNAMNLKPADVIPLEDDPAFQEF